MESKIRYLEIIQNVISRMASNSFLLRGWTVTIVVGLFAFANVKDMNPVYMLLALIPTLVFWGLDGYYVHQEKLYRKLYEQVIRLDESKINFNMKTNHVKSKAGSWADAMVSNVLLLFYFPILGLILLSLFYSTIMTN